MNVVDGWIHLYGTKNKKRTNGEKLKKMVVYPTQNSHKSMYITYRRIFAAQWWTFTFTKCKCGCGGYIDIRGPHRLGHFCIFTPMWCSWCGALFRHSFFAVSFLSPFFLISWSKHRPGFLFVRHFVRWKIKRVRRGARQITFFIKKRVREKKKTND